MRFRQGYLVILNEGRQIASKKGVGERVGWDVVGERVGRRDGAWLGAELGVVVGAREGREVGVQEKTQVAPIYELS
jgi:hypothetical protein